MAVDGGPPRLAIFLWCLLATSGSGFEIGSYDLERGRPAKCEPIVIPMCQGIGYNLTRMPNFMDHDDQSEAAIKLNEFAPLVAYGCDVHLRFFLCSLYAPMCTDKVSASIPACRPMCEQARERCAPIMKKFSYTWPDSLDCSRLPTRNDPNALCMEAPENETRGEVKKGEGMLPVPPRPRRRRPLREPGQVPVRGEEPVVRAALLCGRGRLLVPAGQGLRLHLDDGVVHPVLRLHRLHRAHLPPGAAPLPVPGAAHHLPLHVLQRLLGGLHHPLGGRGGEHRLRPRARRAVHHPGGPGVHRLHHRLPRPLLLWHGLLHLVGHPHPHLVPGGGEEVGPRGHRSPQQLLPHGCVGHPCAEDHHHPHHEEGGRGRADGPVLCRKHGLRGPHRLRPHPPVLLPGHRHLLHPHGLRGPLPHPEGDEDGGHQHGEAGEAHGEDRHLLHPLHGAGHLRHSVLLLRAPQHGLLEAAGAAGEVRRAGRPRRRLLAAGVRAHRGRVHAEDLHVAGGGHHQRRVGVELQDAADLAGPVQPQAGGQD